MHCLEWIPIYLSRGRKMRDIRLKSVYHRCPVSGSVLRLAHQDVESLSFQTSLLCVCEGLSLSFLAFCV